MRIMETWQGEELDEQIEDEVFRISVLHQAGYHTDLSYPEQVFGVSSELRSANLESDD